MSATSIDEPRGAALRGRAALTLGLCFPAAMLEGFDIQSMGVAAPRMAPALGLSRAELGPLFSASIIGLLIGAVILGRAADRFGRKRVLVASVALFGLFSAATALTRGFEPLLAVRFLAGLGLGGAMPNMVALSAEAVAPERRVRLVTRLAAGFPFGGAMAGLTALTLDWRGVFWVGGLAPLALAPALAWALPESRAFLASRAAQPAEGQSPAGERAHSYLDTLFGGGRAAPTLLLWTASFASLLSLYVLLNWLPTLLGDKGLSKAAGSQVSVLFNLGSGAGVLALAQLIERRRKGRTIVFWYAGLGASLAALALAGPGFAAAAASGCAVGFFISSAPAPLYGLAPGHYAVAIRGAGVGASVAAGRLGAIAGPLLAAALLGLGAGADGVLLALLPIALIAGAATLALIGRPALVD